MPTVEWFDSQFGSVEILPGAAAAGHFCLGNRASIQRPPVTTTTSHKIRRKFECESCFKGFQGKNLVPFHRVEFDEGHAPQHKRPDNGIASLSSTNGRTPMSKRKDALAGLRASDDRPLV